MQLYDLTEELSDDQFQMLVKMLKNRCKHSLAAFSATNLPLYRGIKTGEWDAAELTPIPDVRRASSPKSRGPLDSSLSAHKYLVAMQEEAYWPLTRANSLFCTTRLVDAENYASNRFNVMLVFPIDGFKFAWHTRANDLAYPSTFALFYDIAAGDQAERRNIMFNVRNFVQAVHDEIWNHLDGHMQERMKRIYEVMMATENDNNYMDRYGVTGFMDMVIHALEDFLANFLPMSIKFNTDHTKSFIVKALATTSRALEMAYLPPQKRLELIGWKLGKNPNEFASALDANTEVMIRGEAFYITTDQGDSRNLINIFGRILDSVGA